MGARFIMSDTENITYDIFPNGFGFYANSGGNHIGEITFVQSGGDKMIIDYTFISDQYKQDKDVGLNLVRCVANLARSQHRKVIPMCPYATAVFSRYSEFDDVRFLHVR